MNPLRYLCDGYRWLVDPYAFLDEASRRCGLTFRVRLPVLGEVLMTGDPRMIDEIVHHPNLGGGKAVAALRAILGGRSLIMLEGEAHAARRRLVSPLLRGDALEAYDELTVRATREVLQRLPRGQTFSMYTVLQRIGLRVMVAAMFGQDSARCAEAEKVVEQFLSSFRNPLVLFLRFMHVNAGPWGRALRNRERLCAFIRKQMTAGQHNGSQTILSRLIAGAKTESEEDLVEEVLSLLLFGHDTAAATMAWVFAHLYGNAEALRRVRAEATGARRLDSLHFLEASIKESMRLCPVVVHLARSAAADLRLGSFDVRQGQKVIPCTYLAQHNPEVFPAPHQFQPERFLNGQRYEHSFFPFGFGSRICVGKWFAMRQMLLVISTAVTTADLELAPGYRPMAQRQLVLMAPRGGPPMRKRSS